MNAIVPPHSRPHAGRTEPSAPEQLDEIDPSTNGTRPLDTLPATVALAALSVVTAVGFCRVFAGWEFLAPMIVVVVGVHATSFALRALQAPGYIAIPASVLVLFGLIAWKYYPTTLFGPFPSSVTWHLLSADIRLAREQFPSAVAPVAAVGGFVVAASTAVGVAAILSDAFAFRAFGRAEAAVPTAVLFVFAAALGVDSHRVTLTAVWLAAALAAIAVLRMTHAAREHAWIGSRSRVLLSVVPLAAALAGCAALSGAIVGPKLPGAGEKGLIDTRDHNSVTQVLSPLVTIRSQLVNQSDVELFTVNSPEPHYWRSSGLTEFDGTTWGIPVGTQAGNFDTPNNATHRITQNIHILGLGGPLLPAAYTPTKVTGGKIYYVPLTATLVEPDAGLKRGANYEIVSSVLDLNADQLRATSSAAAPAGSTDLPSGFPPSAAGTALQITAGAGTVYDKSLALQTWFRENFTYDLSIQRGHSDDALENFLRIKRGYCEQFSAAFAAMARSVGVPARVAVGFTYGDKGDDGLFHVYGRNAHAWPEVWFDNIGWVSFEPTPGRGEPGTQAYSNTQPAQAAPSDGTDQSTTATVVGDPAATTTTAAAAGGSGGPTTTIRDQPAPTTTTPTKILPANSSDSSGPSGWTLLVLVLVIAAAVWALLLRMVLRALAARGAPTVPAERIKRAWERSVDAFALIGLAPAVGETPIEHARRAERMTGIDRRTLQELALDATAAIYGGVGDEIRASRCELLSANILGAVRDRLSPLARAMALFDPRKASLLVTE